jgi:ferredoxin
MIRVVVNRETCEGYATCVRHSSSIFDLDDDGLVTLKQEVVGDDQVGLIRRASYDCPTDSISFVEE